MYDYCSFCQHCEHFGKCEECDCPRNHMHPHEWDAWLAKRDAKAWDGEIGTVQVME